VDALRDRRRPEYIIQDRLKYRQLVQVPGRQGLHFRDQPGVYLRTNNNGDPEVAADTTRLRML